MTTEASESAISTLDVLLAARKLIEKPENWCQYRYGTGSAMCAEAAILRSSFASSHSGYSALVAVCDLIGAKWTDLPEFNDAHTHAEVLALFDRAIENERTKASRTDDALGAAQRE
jgi:hypothetical protein